MFSKLCVCFAIIKLHHLSVTEDLFQYILSIFFLSVGTAHTNQNSVEERTKNNNLMLHIVLQLCSCVYRDSQKVILRENIFFDNYLVVLSGIIYLTEINLVLKGIWQLP